MKTKTMTLTAMLTGIALIIFIIESQIPSLMPVPGIKLGLSNIITLFAIASMNKRQAALILFLRISLGCILTGNMNTFIYSASGGILCFIAMSIAIKFLNGPLLWVTSVVGAVMHNFGQLIAAAAVMGSFLVFYSLPVLVLSGIVTGIFTGLCAYYVLKNKHINKILRDFK